MELSFYSPESYLFSNWVRIRGFVSPEYTWNFPCYIFPLKTLIDPTPTPTPPLLGTGIQSVLQAPIFPVFVVLQTWVFWQKKCTCPQMGLSFLLRAGDTTSPLWSLGFLVLQWKVNTYRHPGGSEYRFSHYSEGKPQSSNSSQASCRGHFIFLGRMWPWLLISLLTIASGHLSKYIEIFIRFVQHLLLFLSVKVDCKGAGFQRRGRYCSSVAWLFQGQSLPERVAWTWWPCEGVSLWLLFPQWH